MKTAMDAKRESMHNVLHFTFGDLWRPLKPSLNALPNVYPMQVHGSTTCEALLQRFGSNCVLLAPPMIGPLLQARLASPPTTSQSGAFSNVHNPLNRAVVPLDIPDAQASMLDPPSADDSGTPKRTNRVGGIPSSSSRVVASQPGNAASGTGSSLVSDCGGDAFLPRVNSSRWVHSHTQFVCWMLLGLVWCHQSDLFNTEPACLCGFDELSG